MSRNNSIYKEAFNRGLDYVKGLEAEATLPSEKELSEKWGISRTTVRAVLTHLDETGLVRWAGRKKTVLRAPAASDYYASEETISPSARVETQFMEYIIGGDLKPGTILRESELVREFGASTSVVREFLIRFSRFGLIEKEPNRHWVLRGFTRGFAIELFDVREMYELRAFKQFLDCGAGSEQHLALLDLEAEHVHFVEYIETEYLTFPRLDEKFHQVLISELHNRFIADFFELVSVIFHYHYRWNKQNEKDRNLQATLQHLDVIRAVDAADFQRAQQAFEAHLQSARTTLLSSVTWDSGS